MRFKAATVFAMLLLSACAGIRAVAPNQPINVGDDITVQTQTAWANAYGPTVSGILWTIDGFGLNELRFLTGIAPGAPVMQVQGLARGELAYDATMLPNDVMELIASTLTRSGNQQLRTAGLKPAPFGPVTGFRFDLDFATRDGLQMKGIALFVQRRGKLDVILFVAPSEYYFDRHLPVVESVLNSIRVPDAPATMAASG